MLVLLGDLDGFAVVGVVLHAVGVRGDVIHQVVLQQLERRPLAVAADPACGEVPRQLQQATQIPFCTGR